MKPSKEQRYWDALKLITSYASPAYLHRNADRDYGLRGSEAIEMAYENVLETAKRAVRGTKRPKS